MVLVKNFKKLLFDYKPKGLLIPANDWKVPNFSDVQKNQLILTFPFYNMYTCT